MGTARATDTSALARQLRAHIHSQVRIDAGARALYATDRRRPAHTQRTTHD
ncbi:MAG TPA: hypothetical protein VIJ82_26320 [Streptosporangiaceae bacterium]